MNRKIIEWIGLTLSLIILGLSIFLMVSRFSDNPKGILNTYTENINISYTDINASKVTIDHIMDTFKNNDELGDLLFPVNISTSKNTEEPYSENLMSLLGIEDLEEFSGHLGPVYNRPDIFNTGVGLAVLNIQVTDSYRYQAALSKSSAIPNVGAFRWVLADIDGNELFRYEDFEHSFQGEIELTPGYYFLYYDYDDLPKGIDITLVWN
jgi:hypothetical protein